MGDNQNSRPRIDAWAALVRNAEAWEEAQRPKPIVQRRSRPKPEPYVHKPRQPITPGMQAMINLLLTPSGPVRIVPSRKEEEVRKAA